MDFKKEKYIQTNENSKLFLVFFLFCIAASIINGNGFQKFNNIYFVIHSAIFFYLMMLNNYRKEDYFDNLNYLIIIILSGISIIALLTLFMFISNKLGITKKISIYPIKKFFIDSAPVNGRWYTIISNPNTYSHLVSMTFFLALIPLIRLKKTIYKLIIIIMQLICFIVLVFSGSKGALVSIVIGVSVSIVYLLLTLYKKGKKKSFFRVIGIILIIISSALIIFFSIPKLERANIIAFFTGKILKTNRIKGGSGRFEIWNSLLNLPLITNPFGYSDNYIYKYMSSLNIKEFQVFLNNQGRAHNIFLQVLVSFGSIGFFLFIICLLRTFIQVFKNHIKIQIENKFVFDILLIQFVVILIGGLFEQLPIFNMSTHSLIFMFVWVNLLTIVDFKS